MSPTSSRAISLTRSPAPYASITIARCFFVGIAASMRSTSVPLRTPGRRMGTFTRTMSATTSGRFNVMRYKNRIAAA
jgi:hypothetical protein